LILYDLILGSFPFRTKKNPGVTPGLLPDNVFKTGRKEGYNSGFTDRHPVFGLAGINALYSLILPNGKK